MENQEFGALMQRLADAACAADGAGVAACFANEGIYHDVFYGTFAGHDAIVDMIENWFHRDATNFKWIMHDPMTDGAKGYARYTFSYESKLAGCEGKRGMFEGVSVVTLSDGRLTSYREIAESGVGFAALDFAPERSAKIFKKMLANLRAEDEWQVHLAP